jgi:hypothetical protein
MREAVVIKGATQTPEETRLPKRINNPTTVFYTLPHIVFPATAGLGGAARGLERELKALRQYKKMQ